MAEYGFRVTVEDLKTGETGTRIVTPDDYFILTTGDCRVDSVSAYANGTHQLTIKGRANRAGTPSTDHRGHKADNADDLVAKTLAHAAKIVRTFAPSSPGDTEEEAVAYALGLAANAVERGHR